MRICKVSALTNNCIWILYNQKKYSIIIDPGDATPVLNIINKKCLIPIAIFLTHHHDDHVNGVVEILKHFNINVYGPQETKNKGTTKIVSEKDSIKLLNKNFNVLFLPGHTLGHIGFYSYPWLFCGDSFFSGGCGRLIEGSYKQMYNSIKKINKLPSKTLIYSGHEYIFDNLNFALSVLKKDKFIKKYLNKLKKLNLQNKPILPTCLFIERKINIFLRCNEIVLKKSLNYSNSCSDLLIFKTLRKKKDNFEYL